MSTRRRSRGIPLFVVTAVPLALAAWCLTAIPVFAEEGETHWGGPAEFCYETGFVQGLQRADSGGVCLFGMELIENDAAGAGRSERGVYGDAIWGPNRARKILYLDDPRAQRAFVVLFTHSGHDSADPSHALTFWVNGQEGRIVKANHEVYRWESFPASALKEGENIIEMACPAAESAEEGWNLYLARADEFEAGGGDPARVGETSFKSTDGGRTWEKSPFGPEGNTRAEYSIRLSLDRYLPEGTLETPVIDLWSGDSDAFFVPLRRLVEVAFEVDADVPAGTSVTYFVRRGVDPSPYGADWEPYEQIGRGAALRATVDGEGVQPPLRPAQGRAENNESVGEPGGTGSQCPGEGEG